MKKISDLATLMELKYQTSQVELRVICAQEAKIREQILRLDQQSKSSTCDEARMMKSLGADLLWNAWASRTKADLNTKLAQVLAKKELFLHAARRDFGKMLVSQKLSVQEDKARQKSKMSKKLDRILESLSLEDSPKDQ